MAFDPTLSVEEVFGKIWRQIRADKPKYPTTLEEEERRRAILRQDPTYRALRKRYDDPNTPQGKKDRIFEELCNRRWEIMTANETGDQERI